jgi:3-hydroxyisobutyrate dehydrogenase
MNNSTQKKFKQFVLSGKFNSNFSLDLLVKDLGIALSIAGEKEASVPFSELCRTMWSDAAKQLGKGKDHTEMARYCEHVAGVDLIS